MEQMKTLTKIRLINWHYFTDETIHVKGSVLFSGENASGKSTVLDAIQFVLTVNSGHFNPAANEKSKRDLRGYVRCKTGEEGNTYIRSAGAVISYIALEFYEESKDRYFVIGVKLDSPDLDADITKKWFCIEGNMDSLSFVVNGKPATDKEFTQNGKRVQFELQVKRARDNFKARLGRLDDKFPEMIAKSMAFKPMNKVKDFINQFILPERTIETGNLQENIRNLKEMQKLINDVKQQIEKLHKIIDKADEIENKEYDILVIEILIQIAKIEKLQVELQQIQKKKNEDETLLSVLKKDYGTNDEHLKSVQERLNELNIVLASNECGRLIEKIENEIRTLKSDKLKAASAQGEYLKYVDKIEKAIKFNDIQNSSCHLLKIDTTSVENRIEILENIKRLLKEINENLSREFHNAENDEALLKKEASDLINKIDELKKNKMSYDKNTTILRQTINDEFSMRRINSEARVFADLLEIEMPEWADAVEGYLNNQRFYIIVDPEYYDIAAEVYDKIKEKIHSAGLVNTAKLDTETADNIEGTLAEVVRSDNRFARAYANYILGRVKRCDNVKELKNYNIAITKTCMKYQGHVLSKINPEIYHNPYIGAHALQIQLENAQKQFEDINNKIINLQLSIDNYKQRLDAIEDCEFSAIKDRIDAASKLKTFSIKIQEEEKELIEAKNNPTYIDLVMKKEEVEKTCSDLNEEIKKLNERIINKERDIKDKEANLTQLEEEINQEKIKKDEIVKDNFKALDDAQKKYQNELRKKQAETIYINYGPRKQALENQKENAVHELIRNQTLYKDGDFGTGMEVMQLYRDDLTKLEKADLIIYEDKLAAAQKECELEFRENFLARMRENIEKAEGIFANLNKSLKGIYYGNDSYKFELTGNHEKQSLYEMITSEINVGDQSLFTSTFEEKYHAEMEDLFSKLTDENLADSNAIKELTDYRSYLDYDIQVISKDGRMQRFSKTYGEKSGGETQTPYYVAIAASFAQMYSDRETTRIIMLDEAFNNMDEDRIDSMMRFFKSQNFQIILASPPARMEIIGEHVDSIYLVIRVPEKNISTIEEYFL